MDLQLQEIKETIQTEAGVLLYFSGEDCNVCHALRPKFSEVFSEHFPLVKQIFLDAHIHAEIAAQFQVFSVPTMIVYLQGQEFAREGRAVSLHQLTQRLQRPYEIMLEAGA